MTLDDLRMRAESCTACPLSETRTRTVFGCGPSDARVMLVGEAPGKNEDEQGLPFVGKAGHQLDELLSLAGLSRDLVFIANVLKCRPPKNRNPRRDEIAACSSFLEGQISAIDPLVIVTLGNFPTRFVLGSKDGITELRGREFSVDGRVVIPVYHPAATIYDRKKLPVLEDDFRFIGRVAARLGAVPAP